jgi:glycosyltransferase involved in cell wall biosynthesis
MNNSPLSILHVIDTTGPGGAETIFIQLADKLRLYGHKSIVVIRGKGWVYDELVKRNLNPIIVPCAGSFAFGYIWQLTKLIKKHKIQLIQSHLLGSNVYSSILGLICRIPVVATYHGMVDVNPNERFRRLKMLMMRWGISRYVAVSKKLAEKIAEKKLLDPQKTQVIYNGIDTDLYTSPTDMDSTLFPDIPTSAILVGSLGNIRPAKAYDNLISAAAEVLKRLPDVHFIIAGHIKEPLTQTLKQQAHQLGISSHIHFLGYCANTINFLHKIHIFALSSSSEGFSIATIEAMASGKPVVATRCGGPEEIIDDGKNGVLVEINNSTLLANAIIHLIHDDKLSAELASNGRKKSQEEFSLNKMLAAYNNIYQSIY